MTEHAFIENGFIPAERQRLLLERIEQHGRIASAQAASEFAVSEDTIRRDLRDLAEAGLVERVHGGALRKTQISHRFETRLVRHEDEKMRLAGQALSLIADGMAVLLDQSTTNLTLAHLLPLDANLTIVTPSPDIAVAVLDRGIGKVVLIGGQIDPQSRSSTGAGALEQIMRIRPALCFLGACAVDITAGLTAMDHDDACLKRAMIAASRTIVALVTADKLDTSATYHVAPYGRLDHMVTERNASGTLLQRYQNTGVEIHLA